MLQEVTKEVNKGLVVVRRAFQLVASRTREIAQQALSSLDEVKKTTDEIIRRRMHNGQR